MIVEIVGLETDRNDSDILLMRIKYKLPALLSLPYSDNSYDNRVYQDYRDSSQRRRNKAKEELKELHLGLDARLVLSNPREEYDRGFDDGYYEGKGIQHTIKRKEI